MKYDVPLIPQTTSMSCWAASIAMVLGWQNNATYSPEHIARNVGGINYMPQFANGLDPSDKYILRRNGFELEAPQCYTEEAVAALLRNFGPLWVASAVPSPHIRVACGLENGHVAVNDPAPVGSGARYTSPFVRFFGRMERLGARELGHPDPVYVAYLSS